MIGVVYKFTIVSKFKINENKPFYIGQHFCLNESDLLKFSNRNYVNYLGSGKIWNDCVIRLKQLNPNNWCKFIKREILYAKEDISQKALDVLEAHFIKKYKAHYSFGLGGCNILWGTANEFGSGSPMKDPNIRKARSEYMKEYYKTHKHPCLGKKLTKEQREVLSKSHLGKVHSREVIERMSAKLRGRKRGEKFCNLMKEIWAKRKESGWVSPVKGRKQNKDIVEKRRIGILKWNKEHPGARSGWKMSDESKMKVRLARLGKKRVGKATDDEIERRRIGAIRGWEKRRNNQSLEK